MFAARAARPPFTTEFLIYNWEPKKVSKGNTIINTVVDKSFTTTDLGISAMVGNVCVGISLKLLSYQNFQKNRFYPFIMLFKMKIHTKILHIFLKKFNFKILKNNQTTIATNGL